ncbi:hypothetical protein [Parageobacillus toebii]|jgi:hypothetical protein|uniref:hypothetical protein n=1 Tax=Parageobacillus toebii TaxID=153151 RepID=UPI002E204DDB|nr:hypothetical protein [Parageobacillus toebii]
MREPAFDGTVLEGRERRYTIINERDLKKYVHPEKLDRFYELLNDVLGDIEDGREADGKKPYNCYIVINVDEPYVNEIIEVMKRHGHWD